MAIKYLKKAIKTPSTDEHKTRTVVQNILNDIEKSREDGIKEIILLGQNVNAYHGLNINGKQVDLAYLINKISEFDQIKRNERNARNESKYDIWVEKLKNILYDI